MLLIALKQNSPFTCRIKAHLNMIRWNFEEMMKCNVMKVIFDMHFETTVVSGGICRRAISTERAVFSAFVFFQLFVFFHFKNIFINTLHTNG